MTVALALTEPSPDSLRSEWTADQVRLIKSTLTTNLTDAEFALFAQVCHRTGLDPFTRQIYAIKRRQRQGDQWVERMTIQTGIDGYRVTAERTGEYVGGDAPAYGPACECGDGRLGPHPEWSEVSVRRLKAGQLFTTSERADFHEYVVLNRSGSPQGLWQKMPKRMLAKCAEALALRRAFPSLLHGVYTQEEMAQADTEVAVVTVEAPPALPEPSEDVPGFFDDLDEHREAVAGDKCLQCAVAGFAGFYRLARGGPMKGTLQCNGRDRDGNWCNHPAMPCVPDEVACDPTPIDL
jgi:phage recombination protein Bet